MLSTRFVLLAALISASLGRTVPQNTPRRRSAPPEGYAVVSAAPQGETITFRISLPQKSFPGLEKALYAASTPGSKQFGQYLTKDQVRSVDCLATILTDVTRAERSKISPVPPRTPLRQFLPGWKSAGSPRPRCPLPEIGSLLKRQSLKRTSSCRLTSNRTKRKAQTRQLSARFPTSYLPR